ncbi:thiamine biosynthesis protein ThiS (plasmid) [Candidatus Pantoea edessiphila]|uniref:Thiamine biosynthesis protein ThiS n=1 Tax=Candidatus Pantoea edessiphila TaxID=2044610 RepID=A0A2P5SXC2_9GAMM|nr:sulfur carrier protein ThiS [Candidatus Pantoea edessiphila]MBK4775897.1 sulfur carrier protein ThiS [Pantoea sp. Edef]PPI86950.1 thiamine biosynthesis protein ThiS [Candidatus Pantoea edessiphila]
MQINFNDDVLEILEPIDLNELILKQCGNIDGIAIAVNNKIITINQWSQYKIKNNDEIVVFQAIAGG